VRDFHVRWNSTYLMLTRLLAVQQIINDITYTPQPRTGLTAKHIKKLKSLANNHLDWELLQSLATALTPFYLATRCLSGRQYPTLTLSYWVTQNLHLFLSTEIPDAPLENAFLHLLLNKFRFYFESKVTFEQKRGKLIAAYLDPFTLEELSVEEIDEAESLITNEAKICGAVRQQPTTTTPPSQLPQQQSSSSSITITKRSRVSTINQFKSSCHRTPAATPKSAQTQKPLSIKEEF
ncbi:unnamed protein product, partial [Didymodactylos carnosus]